MMIRPLLLSLSGVALLLGACSAPANYDVQRPCTTDDECPGAYCEQGYCASGDGSDGVDVDEHQEVDTNEGSTSPTTEDTGSEGGDDEPTTAGTIGTLCSDDAQCVSGRCLWTGGDRTCVSACDEGCTDGAVCSVARGDRGEPLRFCVLLEYRDCEDADLDGFGVGEMCLGDDCDDANPDVNPEHEEVCDEIDNNCDGEVDDGVTFVNACGGCRVLDGEPGAPCGSCNTGTYTCDGLEDVTCEGESDEVRSNACGGCSVLELEPGLPCGACGDGTVVCAGAEAVVCEGSRPAPPEICDGVDNDCDGEIDEENPEGGAVCETGELGACAAGVITCSDGALVCLPQTPAATEVCDGEDNDCDGLTDENVLGTFFQDSDGDGAGNPNVVIRTCTAPPGYVRNGDDCNDARADIVTGACTPGALRTSSCGMCGTQTETCSLTCQWAVTTSCTDQGVCMPGSLDFTGCAACQATQCNDVCTWGDPPPAPGTASAADNDGICEECFCDAYTDCATTCRTDYHISGLTTTTSCSQAIRCSPNCGYTFATCEYDCPAGYYIYALSEGFACTRASGFAYQRGCRMIGDDNHIRVCDSECPPGFTRTGSGTSFSCGYEGSGYYLDCTR